MPRTKKSTQVNQSQVTFTSEQIASFTAMVEYFKSINATSSDSVAVVEEPVVRKRVRSTTNYMVRWTPQEVEQLINMYINAFEPELTRTKGKRADSTKVVERIAKTLGRTPDAILFKIHEIRSLLTNGEIGLPVNRWTDVVSNALDKVLSERKISTMKAVVLFLK
jgi:hypothetical protein